MLLLSHPMLIIYRKTVGWQGDRRAIMTEQTRRKSCTEQHDGRHALNIM